MKDYEKALTAFIDEYEDNDDIIGAILCGSYANGNDDEFSDIDIHIIARNDIGERERGNKKLNDYLIEYYITPLSELYKDLDKEYLEGGTCTANMIGYGKVLFDKTGEIETLQQNAILFIDKEIPNIDDTEMEMNKYSVWDFLDELKRCLIKDTKSFNIIYYKLLNIIFDSYLKYNQIPRLPITKAYDILTNENYRINYHVFKLPDEKFKKIFIECYSADRKDIMYNNIKTLSEYYYYKTGGFDINNFSLKEEVRKDNYYEEY